MTPLECRPGTRVSLVVQVKNPAPTKGAGFQDTATRLRHTSYGRAKNQPFGITLYTFTVAEVPTVGRLSPIRSWQEAMLLPYLMVTVIPDVGTRVKVNRYLPVPFVAHPRSPLLASTHTHDVPRMLHDDVPCNVTVGFHAVALAGCGATKNAPKSARAAKAMLKSFFIKFHHSVVYPADGAQDENSSSPRPRPNPVEEGRIGDL